MDKPIAQRLSRKLNTSIDGSEYIQRKISKKEIKESKRRYRFYEGREDIAAYEIKFRNNDYSLQICTWSRKERDRYYVLVIKYPYNIICIEVWEEEDHDLFWRYRPTRQDKSNRRRKAIFKKLHGSLDVVIPLPFESTTSDEFIETLFDIIEKRTISDELKGGGWSKHGTDVEGKRTSNVHERIERNRKIVISAKKAYKEKNDGRSPCEACGFDFGDIYGERGQGYIEAHHKVPLSRFEHEHEVRKEDFVMLCSNCHRMVHQQSPLLSLGELKRLLPG